MGSLPFSPSAEPSGAKGGSCVVVKHEAISSLNPEFKSCPACRVISRGLLCHSEPEFLISEMRWQAHRDARSRTEEASAGDDGRGTGERLLCGLRVQDLRHGEYIGGKDHCAWLVWGIGCRATPKWCKVCALRPSSASGDQTGPVVTFMTKW